MNFLNGFFVATTVVGFEAGVHLLVDPAVHVEMETLNTCLPPTTPPLNHAAVTTGTLGVASRT